MNQGFVAGGNSSTLYNCRFVGNYAEEGGAIAQAGSIVTAINCVFSGNIANGVAPFGRGGAILNAAGGQLFLTNCTFTGNSAGNQGGGIKQMFNASALNITNSIFWGNTDASGSGETAQIDGTASVNYSVVQGGWTGGGGVGNLDADPLFVDADGPDNIIGTEDDNARLLAGSPCIDAADNTAVPADTEDLDNDGNTAEPIPLDLDGNPRFWDDPFTTDTGNGTAPIVDMGAYEFQCGDGTCSPGEDSCICPDDCTAPSQNEIPGVCCNDGQDNDGDTLTDCDDPDCACESACGEDCNTNGVLDECDIADGTSQDCQPNAIPDECDVADGTSEDCNGSGVPDECEPDGDGDGVPDDCDVCPGFDDHVDCDNDGTPDGCETDCQPNGVPDDCDINDGTSQDCNANGTPDDCDIAAGFSQDCNVNGVPDECEPDCNGNGVADSCDINSGFSSDADGNGVPDECELAAPSLAAEGCRYLAVTPAPGALAMAVRVTSPDPGLSCVTKYADANGLLGATPVYQLPKVWGTVHIHGSDIIPETEYAVQSETESGFLSPAGIATTFKWGDVDNNGTVNIQDVFLIVLGFQGDFSLASLQATDLEPCEPNGIVNLSDALMAVLAFQGNSYGASTGCLPPCP